VFPPSHFIPNFMFQVKYFRQPYVGLLCAEEEEIGWSDSDDDGDGEIIFKMVTLSETGRKKSWQGVNFLLLVGL